LDSIGAMLSEGPAVFPRSTNALLGKHLPSIDRSFDRTGSPHRMWATDAWYFRVTGWDYYYMVTVMDDYSRSIMA